MIYVCFARAKKRLHCITHGAQQLTLAQMAALAGVGIMRFKAIRSVLLMIVRLSGNSYGAGACAVTVRSRLPVNVRVRAQLLGDHPSRWFSYSDAKPEVDYSKLVPVVREGGKTMSYNAVWLRENCRCEACFFHATWQRKVVYHLLPPEAFVANRVIWASQEGVVEVTWGDGHLSR